MNQRNAGIALLVTGFLLATGGGILVGIGISGTQQDCTATALRHAIQVYNQPAPAPDPASGRTTTGLSYDEYLPGTRYDAETSWPDTGTYWTEDGVATDALSDEVLDEVLSVLVNDTISVHTISGVTFGQAVQAVDP